MSSKCPKCGTGYAYIGIIDINCVNTECEHYSKPHAVDMYLKHTTPFAGNPEPVKEDDFTADEKYWTELMFNSD